MFLLECWGRRRKRQMFYLACGNGTIMKGSVLGFVQHLFHCDGSNNTNNNDAHSSVVLFARTPSQTKEDRCGTPWFQSTDFEVWQICHRGTASTRFKCMAGGRQNRMKLWLTAKKSEKGIYIFLSVFRAQLSSLPISLKVSWLDATDSTSKYASYSR